MHMLSWLGRFVARVTPGQLRDSRIGKAGQQARTRALLRFAPIREQVLYESFFGANLTDSPCAIFDHLIDSPRYQDLRHVWVVNDERAARAFTATYGRNRRVRFVKRGTFAYARELARSRWLISNSTFPPFFVKRPGQTYVNTWHGTPLKAMGFDMPGGAFEAGNTVRNFLLADYLLSANAHMTDVMYRDAYRLEGIYGGEILEVGYPRVDQSIALASDPDQARNVLADHGLHIPAGRTVVLYAPTWKGASFNDPANDAQDIAALVGALQNRLGDDYYVVTKPHQRVAQHSHGSTELSGRIVPIEVSANAALAAADVLVTDYSSIFFDYLALDRPIVFYVPDSADYDTTRGRYLDPEQLPGPQCTDVAALAAAIRQPTARDQARRAAAKETYAPWEDGHATQRVVDIVFGGKAAAHGRAVRCDNTRPRMLIHLGVLLRNGMSSSVLNLLGELDYDRFDVSVNYATPRTAEARRLIRAVDPRARLLETSAGHAERFATSPWRRARGLVLPAQGLKSKDQARKVFGDEYRRRYGDTAFDYVIDFSGYSARPAVVHLASPPAVHSIWFHNDLAADRYRTVHGKQPNLRSLGQVRELYPLHDRLVSVSAALSDINQASFGAEVPAGKFVAARNVIAGDWILDMAARADARETELGQPGLSREAQQARQAVFDIERGTPVFIAVGRLSPEKNHARLLEAFAALARDDERSRLVVVGTGPLQGELLAHTARLGLDDRVHWVGSTENPFAYMARATCLVMSSDYEGQPMVILEARVLGLSVVSTRFASVDSALSPHEGVVVERDVNALAEGLRMHLAGAVPALTLDYVAYNRECMGEFYRAIGAE